MKYINWNNAIVSIYAVKRTEHNKANKLTGKKEKSYTYKPFLLLTEKKIETKLCNAVTKQIQNWDEIEQYSSGLQEVSKHTALCMELTSTDYSLITNQIEMINSDRKDEDTIAETSDLVKTIMYIVRLEPNEINAVDFNQQTSSILYAARRVPKSWGLEKSDPDLLTRLHLKNGKLLDIGNEPIFSVDKTIDFLSFNQTIFVNQKHNFEYLLNLRLTFMKKMHTVVNEFFELGLVSDKESFVNVIGTNLRNLQKIASICERKYYMNPNYLSELKKIAETDNWYLHFTSDGKIDLEYYIDKPKELMCMLRELNGERKLDRIDGDECYAGVIVRIPDNRNTNEKNSDIITNSATHFR